jgi:hypothetical protein
MSFIKTTLKAEFEQVSITRSQLGTSIYVRVFDPWRSESPDTLRRTDPRNFCQISAGFKLSQFIVNLNRIESVSDARWRDMENESKIVPLHAMKA